MPHEPRIKSWGVDPGGWRYPGRVEPQVKGKEPMMRLLGTVGRAYTKLLEILIGVLFTGMIVVGFAGVIARYLLANYVSLYWAEEVIRYSFLWAVFLVSPLVIRRGANLELDIFILWLPPPMRRVIALCNVVVILAFLLILIVQGIVMVRVNVDQLSSALEFSMAWVYLAVPVGGVLMLGEYLRLLPGIWHGKTTSALDSAVVAVQ